MSDRLIDWIGAGLSIMAREGRIDICKLSRVCSLLFESEYRTDIITYFITYHTGLLSYMMVYPLTLSGAISPMYSTL